MQSKSVAHAAAPATRANATNAHASTCTHEASEAMLVVAEGECQEVVAVGGDGGSGEKLKAGTLAGAETPPPAAARGCAERDPDLVHVGET